MQYGNIYIKNIYYMLSYAFKELQDDGMKSIETENFKDMLNLMAIILEKGVSNQLKSGLLHQYVEQSKSLSVLNGKLDISNTLKQSTLIKQKVVCTFNEYTKNYQMNRILKSTISLLIRSDMVNKNYREKLKRLVMYFSNIDNIELKRVNWSVLQFNHNNSGYRLLMNICKIIVDDMLYTTEDGKIKLRTFSEKTMSRLYENFIREYYIKHYSSKINVLHSQIQWAVDDDTTLPKMQSDIILKHNNHTLIIDAKYYSTIMSTGYHSNKKTFHSNNLYQIFTYVKNEAAIHPKATVSGMLLYAKSSDDNFERHSYQMSDNNINLDCLDLNCEFHKIKSQLDGIAENFITLQNEL